MYVCNTITFDSLHVESSFSHIPYAISREGVKFVKFVYKGHRVKVKVTGAKKHKIPYSRMLMDNNSVSIEDRA